MAKRRRRRRIVRRLLHGGKGFPEPLRVKIRRVSKFAGDGARRGFEGDGIVPR
ncbi:hypothetical protein Fmac_017654 [Flemingia macrophylla]|uniref:Uncharacterized protein n=1 Tax=Flemingia macrophylla TaxID=520843 RepID=A0ABD1M2S5_9FABA